MARKMSRKTAHSSTRTSSRSTGVRRKKSPPRTRRRARPRTVTPRTPVNATAIPRQRPSNSVVAVEPAALSSVDPATELQRLQQDNHRLRELLAQAPLGAPPPEGPAKELSPEVRDARQSFAETLPVPGRDAPSFSLVNDFLSFSVTPWADALVPAYLLDKNYRIVDWNLAFSLAFDRTMEGRRGMSVLEWVYFLDNYEECLKRAVQDFGNAAELPRLHVEEIHYTSPNYGKVSATKRAYQMPADSGELLGWLVTLDTRFADLPTTLRFRRELYSAVSHDMVWSEYALSYDQVLLATKTYRQLLQHILGEAKFESRSPGLAPLADRSRVLDLGAGTGNIAHLLASQRRGHIVFALENNRVMLDLLREKCRDDLRYDNNGPGVLAVKQDINSLYGIPASGFDYAILNNVAYSLDDPVTCFRQVYDALKKGGEIRVSGPQKSTDLNHLFRAMAADLRESGQLAALQADFQRVEHINQTVLAPRLYRWTVRDMQDLLRSAGFRQFVYTTDTAYAGQAMIVAARK